MTDLMQGILMALTYLSFLSCEVLLHGSCGELHIGENKLVLQINF